MRETEEEDLYYEPIYTGRVRVYPIKGLIYMATRDGHLLPGWLQQGFESGKLKVTDRHKSIIISGQYHQLEIMDGEDCVIVLYEDGEFWPLETSKFMSIYKPEKI